MNPHSFDCLPHQVDHILDCLPHQVDHILTVDTTSDAPACHYLCAECSRRFRTLRGFQRHSDFRRSRGRCPQAADGPVSPAKTSPPPGGNLGGNLGGSPPPGGSPPHRAWDRADLGGNLGPNLGGSPPRPSADPRNSRSPPSYSTPSAQHSAFDAALASKAAQLGTSFGRASPSSFVSASFVSAYDRPSGTMGYTSGPSATRGASFASGSSLCASSIAPSIGRQPGSYVAGAQLGARPLSAAAAARAPANPSYTPIYAPSSRNAYATPHSSLEAPYRAPYGSPRADSASSASGYSPGRGHLSY